jgi:hypothetical protein
MPQAMLQSCCRAIASALVVGEELVGGVCEGRGEGASRAGPAARPLADWCCQGLRACRVRACDCGHAAVEEVLTAPICDAEAGGTRGEGGGHRQAAEGEQVRSHDDLVHRCCMFCLR